MTTLKLCVGRKLEFDESKFFDPVLSGEVESGQESLQIELCRVQKRFASPSAADYLGLRAMGRWKPNNGVTKSLWESAKYQVRAADPRRLREHLRIPVRLSACAG
jgi:hypothetical protein